MGIFEKDAAWCNRCRGFHGPDNHKPTYRCWLADGDTEDDATEIGAYDAESAAEEYLDYCWGNRDGWEWILGRNSSEASHVVLVRSPNGELSSVEVRVELAPSYHGRVMT